MDGSQIAVGEFSISEENWRKMAAQQMATRFIAEFSFRSLIALMSPAGVADICEDIREAVRKTDQFRGMTPGDDWRAEQLSDLVIRAQEIVVEMVDEAERSIREAQAESDAPPYKLGFPSPSFALSGLCGLCGVLSMRFSAASRRATVSSSE